MAAFFAATENNTPAIESPVKICGSGCRFTEAPLPLWEILESWLRNDLKQLP